MQLVLTSGAARIELHISGLDGSAPQLVIDEAPDSLRPSGSMFRGKRLLVLTSVAVVCGFVGFQAAPRSQADQTSRPADQAAENRPAAPLAALPSLAEAGSQGAVPQAAPPTPQRVLRELQTPPLVVPPPSAAPADGKGGNPFGLQ